MRHPFLLLLFAALSYAGIPTDTVWQLQTVGSADTNCGGWSNANKGATGVDHSTTAGTTFTSTLSATGTTTLTNSAASFLNTMLGNCVNIVGQGTYFITAFLTTSTVTVDRTLGTFSTTSGHEGGPALSIGHICSLPYTSGNTIFFKNDGTFSITSATDNVNSGTCNVANQVLMVGYTSNRTIYNADSPPTIQLNVASARMFQLSSSVGTLFNVILDGNSQTSSKAVQNGIYINMQFKNFNTASSGNNYFFNALSTANSANVLFATHCYYCEAYANTATGIALNGGQAYTVCAFCLSYSNTGASTDGIFFDGSIHTCLYCTVYNNGRDGLRDQQGNEMGMFNNVYAESNVGVGINLTSSTFNRGFLGFGYFGNGTDFNSVSGTFTTTAITPASSAFVSATNLNSNATANAGALLRGVGYPGQFPRGLTQTFTDVNAARHKDPSATFGVAIGN